MIDKRDLFIKSTIYEGDSEDDTISSESGCTSGEITPLNTSTPRLEIRSETLPSTPKTSPRVLGPQCRASNHVNKIMDELANLRSQIEGIRYPGPPPRRVNQLRAINPGNSDPKLNTIEEEIVTYTMQTGGNTITLRTNNPWIKRNMKINEFKDNNKMIPPSKPLKSKFLLADVLKPEPPVDIGFEKRAERAIFMQDLLLSSLKFDNEDTNSNSVGEFSGSK